MTTRYEFVDGAWYVIVLGPSFFVVEAEINRLRGSDNVTFMGPYKTGDKYVAWGMLHAVSVG